MVVKLIDIYTHHIYIQKYNAKLNMISAHPTMRSTTTARAR